MAWIESHQEMRNHPKTKRLARTLGIPPAAATGYLHWLWWWAVDYAPDGDLTEYDDWEIADAAGYDGDEEAVKKFKDALISAGFLDNTEQGTLIIHDWTDYAGKNLKQRERARQRSQKYREKQAENITEHEQKADVTDTEKERDRDVTHTQRTRNAHGTDSVCAPCASTGQDITGQDSTGHNRTVQDTQKPPSPPQEGGGGNAAKEKPPDTQQKRFEEFWGEYPKKKSKGAAEKAWKKIKPTAELHEKIMAALRDNKARNSDWQRDGGQYIPYPATWLNGKCWEDVIEQPKATKTGGEHSAGGNTRADPGATDYTGFQRSTGFRRTDTEPDD